MQNLAARRRTLRLAAQVTAATVEGPLSPSWDLPAPKDFPPCIEPLHDQIKDGRIPLRTVISEEFQREFLIRSGVDEADFKGTLDPSFVSSMLNAVLTQRLFSPSTTNENKPAAGSYGAVHVSDRITLSRPLNTKESLTIHVRNGVDETQSKGVMSKIPVTVMDAAGKEVMLIERKLLELAPANPSTGKTTKAAQADPKMGKRFVSATQFTPDMVAGYCYFVTNRIHNEVETAQAFGYKAPIWAGTQGMHLTLKHLYSFGVPQTMTAEFSFVRPVFWTDRVELWVSDDLGQKKGVGEYLLLNPEGKVAMSMIVEKASF